MRWSRHHPVHEPEAAQRLRIGQRAVSRPVGQLLADLPRLGDRLLGRLPADARAASRRRVLAVQPGRVAGDDRLAAPAPARPRWPRESASCPAARRRSPGPWSAGSRRPAARWSTPRWPAARRRRPSSPPSRSGRWRTPAGCGTAGSAAAARRRAPSGPRSSTSATGRNTASPPASTRQLGLEHPRPPGSGVASRGRCTARSPISSRSPVVVVASTRSTTSSISGDGPVVFRRSGRRPRSAGRSSTGVRR